MQNSTKANAKKETATRKQSERAVQKETKNRYTAITSIATRLPVQVAQLALPDACDLATIWQHAV